MKAPIEIAFGQRVRGLLGHVVLILVTDVVLAIHIDGRGVFKEFFTSLCKTGGCYLTLRVVPNILFFSIGHSLNGYHFIGRILGKAMYEGILVDVAFAGFFLANVCNDRQARPAILIPFPAWLGKQKSSLDDLASLDPDLYQELISLKHYTGNPEDLSLNFTVAVEGLFEYYH